MNREVEKGRALDEAEAQQVIASLIKQRRDSIEQFAKGGRAELAAQETAEIAMLEAYLPPPVDPGRDRAGRRRGHPGDRRDLGQGHRPCDEGCDDASSPGRASTAHGQRARPEEARRRDFAKPFSRGVPSNRFERHAQASHPSSIRPLSKDRGLFLCTRLDSGTASVRIVRNRTPCPIDVKPRVVRWSLLMDAASPVIAPPSLRRPR